MSDLRHVPTLPLGVSPWEARERLARATSGGESETVPVREAVGRVAKEAATSRLPLPPCHVAAMDGYFVRPDFCREEAFVLPLVGRVPASGVAELPESPAAVEVATGARLLSDGAVVPREHCREDGSGLVHFPGGVPPLFLNVRRQGEELPPGSVVLRPGERIRPWQAALLASTGREGVEVARRPTVRVVVTGDELVGPARAGEGTVETHSLVLAHVLERLGVSLAGVDVVGDDVGRLEQAVGRPADLRITTGGASVGRYDWVGEVAARLGADPLFQGVAVRPGGPTKAYRLPDGLWLALPGNPMAVALGLDWFVTAWWAEKTGERLLTLRAAEAACPLRGGAIPRFLRGTVEGGRFTPHPYQSSASVRTLAETDCWGIVPEGGVGEGGRLTVVASPLSGRGEGDA